LKLAGKGANPADSGVFYLRRTPGSASDSTMVTRGSVEVKLECGAREAVFLRLLCDSFYPKYGTKILIDLHLGYGASIERDFQDDSLAVKETSISCRPN